MNGGLMKRVSLLCFLILATGVMAAPSPEDYLVNIHVYESHLQYPSASSIQLLNVTIEGKKYELSANGDSFLLAIGDYKARLVKDDHRTAYESNRIYELVFLDKKTRRFTVVGEIE
jgi:hypothetical protein